MLGLFSQTGLHEAESVYCFHLITVMENHKHCYYCSYYGESFELNGFYADHNISKGSVGWNV